MSEIFNILKCFPVRDVSLYGVEGALEDAGLAVHVGHQTGRRVPVPAVEEEARHPVPDGSLVGPVSEEQYVVPDGVSVSWPRTVIIKRNFKR